MPELNELARGARVLVTGATGFVAGPLIMRLVGAGSRVHAAVRDPADTAKLSHLAEIAARGPGSIELFQADLLEPGSFDAAIAGCEIVFHTASPFLDMSKINDPQRDFVDPALDGTINVLESVNREPRVMRVVLTSSAAAMAGGPADLDKTGGIVGAGSWNSVSTLENNPYMFSKTIAERAAWDIAAAQDRWQLISINPGTVLGPALGANPTSASFDRVRSLADGTFRDGLPPVRFGMVDVRDVAEAHFRAGFLPGASGRYLIAEKVYSFGDLAEMLKKRYGDAWLVPVHTALPEGLPHYAWDTGKSIKELGLHYRRVEDGLVAMFEQMIEQGLMTRGDTVPAV